MDGRWFRGGKRGFIFLTSVSFVILLSMGSLIALTGTLAELQSAAQQLRDKRAFFRADGSATLCLREMRNRIERDLLANLRALTSLAPIGTLVTNDDPAGLLSTYAYKSGVSFGGAFQHVSATEARLTEAFTPTGGPGAYACTLRVLSRSTPENQGTTVSPVYVFRYRYTIDGSASDGGLTRQVNLQGGFTVRAQQDNFARYALFTNRQENAAGSKVWFTNRTNFTGPVHTNGQFNFAMNPGADFTGHVTSVSETASYYNGGSSVSLNAENNGTTDVPTFHSGFERGTDTIPMPSTTTTDRQKEAALGLSQGASTAGYGTGIHLGSSGGSMTGGIYVNGNASISVGRSGNNATYNITQGSTTTTVTVNYASNQTSVKAGSGPATTYTGVPNGMLFVNGQVDSLAGTVQQDTQLTIAATGDVRITNNLTYESYTGGTTPSAEGATNLLGVMSWNGNVRVATGAPNDINIHATVMAPNGEFRVDNHDSGSSRGTATILGGVIENTYGAFGTFGQSGQTTGYGRNFVYDARMGRGMAPPFFPTIGTVTSLPSGINDRPNWQQLN
jgi:hypothetical protein